MVDISIHYDLRSWPKGVLTKRSISPKVEKYIKMTAQIDPNTWQISAPQAGAKGGEDMPNKLPKQTYRN